MLPARKQLDVITAHRRVGSYRGAAQICGVTHKTVKRIVEKDQAQGRRLGDCAEKAPPGWFCTRLRKISRTKWIGWLHASQTSP